jgi:hypothetical protein
MQATRHLHATHLSANINPLLHIPPSPPHTNQADMGKDDHLSNLITALSDKDMPGKKKEKRIVKSQWLDWITRQLEFVYASGVEIKLKPAASNIYEGDARDIMGLTYAIMLKFMKFDDEDGESAGNAKDALLRWCQFHTKGIANVKVTNLTKSWQDGLALCALVNKFQPGAIAYDTLDQSNGIANLKTAMEAAYGAPPPLQHCILEDRCGSSVQWFLKNETSKGFV